MATRNKSFFSNPLIVVTLGCAIAFATACGDDDDSSGNETPKGGTKATAGTGGSTGGSSTAGKTGKGGTNSAGTETGTAGTPPEPTGGGGAGPLPPVGGEGGMAGAPANCTDDTDKGCYSCAPATLNQFLNHCPTTGCEPFDNSKLTSLKNGALPTL